ncbi:MAG TPA: ABC transporter permease [Candidatus Dormibacteraeota bacterium]|nr:ABC transporter permease [Candidatus Dormibacteraeota bacterium]
MSRCWAFFVRDIRLTIAYPLNFAMQWVSIVIAVFSTWCISKLVPNSMALGLHSRGSYFEYAVVNLAFFSVMQTSMQSVERAIRNDQVLGTLEAILTSVTSGATLIFSSMAWPLVFTVLQVAWYLLLGTLLFGLNIGHANVSVALVCLALIVTSTLPLGILSAAATLRYKQIGPANFFVGGASSLLSGVLFPTTLLPKPLQWVSWLLPITHGLQAVRAALAGATLGSVRFDIVWLALASAILIPLSLLVFVRALERERRNGSLAHY